MKEIINSHISEVNNITNLDSQELTKLVQKNGFHIIRGLINQDEIKKAVQKLKDLVLEKNDHPSADIKPEQIMANFQKWSIGMQSHKDSLPRFFRIIYNPLFAEDIYGLHSSFIKLIELRNHLTQMPLDYAKGIEENNIYSGCRIQHYPCGGGFMQMHRDHVAEANITGTGQENYLQLLIIMSEYGKDFERGGSVVIKDGEKIHPEHFAQLGDIVIYDGLTLHGVEDIDTHKNLDLSIKKGRLVGFCTIFKKW